MLSRGIVRLTLVLAVGLGSLIAPLPSSNTAQAETLRQEVKKLEKELAKKKHHKKKHHHHKKKGSVMVKHQKKKHHHKKKGSVMVKHHKKKHHHHHKKKPNSV